MPSKYTRYTVYSYDYISCCCTVTNYTCWTRTSTYWTSSTGTSTLVCVPMAQWALSLSNFVIVDMIIVFVFSRSFCVVITSVCIRAFLVEWVEFPVCSCVAQTLYNHSAALWPWWVWVCVCVCVRCVCVGGMPRCNPGEYGCVCEVCVWGGILCVCLWGCVRCVVCDGYVCVCVR